MTVIENYEWYLGVYPLLKNLWKLYINYLKTVGESERMLSVYSRYCRLFIDDVEMLSEYEAELVKQSPSGENVAHWWLDIADMERHFGDFRDGRRVMMKAMRSSVQDQRIVNTFFWFQKQLGLEECVLQLNRDWCLTKFPMLDLDLSQMPEEFEFDLNRPLIEFDYPDCERGDFHYEKGNGELLQSEVEGLKGQSFPLRASLIYYIHKRANKSLLFKLIQTCKYFFFRDMPLLCHKLKVTSDASDEQTFISQSLTTGFRAFLNRHFNNFTVTQNLNIIHNSDETICSQILPKINLNIECLCLHFQRLTFTEFEIFAKQRLIICTLYDVRIQRDSGTFLDLADVIEYLPTVERFV